MQIAFKPILNVEIWHDYYLESSNPLEVLPAQYDISAAITLIPTVECQKVLRDLRWIFRPQPFGAILLAHIDATNSISEPTPLTPFVSIAPNTRLTFWMVVRDSHFSNYTNLPLNSPRNHIYYFSNRSENIVPGSSKEDAKRLFLSQPLDRYTPGANYSLGHLVTYMNGRQEVMTLEAVKHHASTEQPPDLEEESSERDWLRSSASQYVSIKDCLPRLGFSYQQPILQESFGNSAQFSLTNLDGQETFLQTVEVSPNHSVGLNFVGQFPGRYQLRCNGKRIDIRTGKLDGQNGNAVNEATSQFVLCDPIASRDAFALIEISLNPSIPDSFQLLHPEKNLLQPRTYRIHFKNRATFWRYYYDSRYSYEKPTNLVPVPQMQHTYATESPKSLCRQSKPITDGTGKKLPVPGVSMIQLDFDRDRNITKIFSDVYL